MSCPDQNECPQRMNNRCKFLLGVSSTHGDIRKKCLSLPRGSLVAAEEAQSEFGIGAAPSKPMPVRGGL